uniref:Uncharacterized protein n=1 Tax=Acrobeloides nanus TaxID=290746 RepID=A0A914BYV1_9BILA
MLFLSGLGESAEFPELQNYMLSVLPFYDIAEIMDRIGMKDRNSPVHEVIRLCLQPASERYNFKQLMASGLYTHLVKDVMKSFAMEDYSRAIVAYHENRINFIEYKINELRFPDDTNLYTFSMYNFKFIRKKETVCSMKDLNLKAKNILCSADIDPIDQGSTLAKVKLILPKIKNQFSQQP